MRDLLRGLMEEGLKVWLDGERLKYSAPKTIANEAVDFLRKHKAEVIAYLLDGKADDYEPAPDLPAGAESAPAVPGPQKSSAPAGTSTVVRKQEEEEPIVNARFIPPTCRGCRHIKRLKRWDYTAAYCGAHKIRFTILTKPESLASCPLWNVAMHKKNGSIGERQLATNFPAR
ncbi:hypothetical protein [Thermodesulforhabdus norvegica]|uniref:TubC N-terminal docking domain-containing protein n=1 Tax=Thermodesulforhabdus norvegica TaxID=39841 RepID=A0A1I4VKE8_9BACT|nr:hypothetical protein [Thermodesulforhabdus norvegica]SFN01722.1 hypothetical protein SAMN05660836_02338 [Thermodesulforhabdus norvegica]